MKLHKLSKTITRSKKRVGRGYGSGKGGHTSGRGAKGKKARGKISLTFTGTKFKKSLLKRLPLGRGKGKLKPRQKGPVIVNLKHLNLFPKNTVVDTAALIKSKLVKEKEVKECGVKILGDGKLEIPLKVTVSCSGGATKKIEKAGGKVIKK